MKSRDQYHVLLARTIPVALSLRNSGSAPADDLDIFLNFPAGMKVLDLEDFPKEPTPPTPPQKPQPGSPFDLYAVRPLSDLAPYLPPIQPIMANVSSPTIENEEAPVVSYHVRRLKHNQTERLDALRVIFAAGSEVRSFSFGYRIHVGNLPDEIVGKLHVAIEKEGDAAE